MVNNKQRQFAPELGSLFPSMGDVDGYGSISANATVSSTTSVLPKGVTFENVSTGLYRFTINEAFVKCFATVSYASDSALALFAQVKSVRFQDGNTLIDVRIVNGSGTATAPTDKGSIALHCRVSRAPSTVS